LEIAESESSSWRLVLNTSGVLWIYHCNTVTDSAKFSPVYSSHSNPIVMHTTIKLCRISRCTRLNCTYVEIHSVFSISRVTNVLRPQTCKLSQHAADDLLTEPPDKV